MAKTNLFNRWKNSTRTLEEGMGSCFRKKAYRTQERAELSIHRMKLSRPYLRLVTYYCFNCEFYHITKEDAHRHYLAKNSI